MDVNEEAVEEWKRDTESHERVWSVLRRADSWMTVEDLAGRGRVTIAEAADVVSLLSDIGLAARRDDAYRIHPTLQVAIDAREILDEVGEDTLDDRLAELPEDGDESTRRNRAIAEVAAAMSEATEYY